MSRFAFVLPFAAIPFLLLAAACGAGDGAVGRTDAGATRGPVDASVLPDAGDEAAASDSGAPNEDAEASEDSEASADAGHPIGTELAAGSVVLLQGVTSDGYAIYIDGMASTLNAVSLSGGAPIPIAAIDPTSVVAVNGPVAFYWTGVNQTTSAGTLGVWSSAYGPQALSSSSLSGRVDFQVASVSADGTMVLFFDGLDEAGTAASLTVAHVDGSGKKALLPGIDVGSTTCYPSFAFAGGSVVSAAAQVQALDAGADAGPEVIAATSFAGPDWSPSTLATGVECTLSVDAKGESALVATSNGLVAFAIPTGAPTPIDSTGISGVFLGTPAGSPAGTADDVLYVDQSTQLKRATVGAASSPTLPLDDGVVYIWAISPDSNWALTGRDYVLVANEYLFDFDLVSASVPGQRSEIVPGLTGVVYGDPFTTDSSHALYSTAPAGGAAASPLTLYAAPATSDAGAARLLARGAGEALAAGGAKVVYGVFEPQNDEAYEVFRVDTSEPAPAVLLVSFADAPFFLSPQKDKLVYTWSQGQALSGLYVLEVP